MNSLRHHIRPVAIGAAYGVAGLIALVAAFLLRFDFTLSGDHAAELYAAALFVLPIKVAVFTLAGLWRGRWRTAGLPDALRLLAANVAAAGLCGLATSLAISIRLLDFLVCCFLTAAIRFSWRLYREFLLGELTPKSRKRIIVYGAGNAGATLARELRVSPSLGYEIVAFVDDDARKRGTTLGNVPVRGAGRDIPQIVDFFRRRGREISEVVIAMPTATARQMRQAMAICRTAGLPCKTIPGIGEILEGKVLTAQIRDLSVNDLLGRAPAELDEARIRDHIVGRKVLVTGAAGSIGSELCRQAAHYGPAALICLDHAESELFRIDNELRHSFPNLCLVPRVADIRDIAAVDEVIHRNGVDVIFHAAAYKHVPLMEAHPLEAVTNNILGTWNLVRAACRSGVPTFVMISSDKAVNPTSVMGVTKRAAELIVSAMPTPGPGPGTRCVSVRFGNVLGSNGSVVPLFQEQIAAGGPVTVTHPEVARYFMTIREAVQLVLQASTMGKGSEIFVLDMGDPIRIVDLARNMIRLSGLEPDEDIEIRYVGLRPGERLFEELGKDGENVLPTHHHKIRIFQGHRESVRRLEAWMGSLRQLIDEGDETGVVQHLQKMVPEYRPSCAWAGSLSAGNRTDAACSPAQTVSG